IAGAADLIIGRHMLFPGSFSRLESLRIGAYRSITIMLSTIPLFMVAGFLESFVTPATTPGYVKIGVIFLSLVLMAFMYVYRPYVYLKTVKRMPSFSDLDDEIKDAPAVYQAHTDESTYVKKSFHFLGSHLSTLLQLFYIPLIIGVPVLMYLYFSLVENSFIYSAAKTLLNHYSRGGFFGLILPMAFFVQMCAVLHLLLSQRQESH